MDEPIMGIVDPPIIKLVTKSSSHWWTTYIKNPGIVFAYLPFPANRVERYEVLRLGLIIYS
ncbi:MAG: hypothetical protein QW389_07965 [Desulfurococcus sp.]|uniref:hypothetical protein n=1 Tax=Desulfurococcus sp. TaxID=51678 RepID=UPI00316144CC